MDLNGKKILLIEDDNHIFELIKAMFKTYDIDFVFKKTGKSGLEEALNNEFDLILLDIMLPEKDGWEVCRQLKSSGKDTPIIMLTAKVEETDKVLGLEMGADDYVTKPFSPRELTARIKAVLRRSEKIVGDEKDKEEELNFSDIGLKIELKSYNVFIDSKKISLPPKEFELLAYLARYPSQVFTRKQLLQQIWGYNTENETRTIDEHVKRLRKNLGEAGLDNIPIQTIWGVGYKFEAEE